MQIHEIARSLKEVTADTPELATLLPGGLHYGARASLGAVRPFATFYVDETERRYNSSGVSLVTYEVTLTVVVNEKIGTTGQILAMFHRYWDRLVSLPTLDADLAKLILIHPGSSELGEAADEDLGKDVILGSTTWTIKLSEHQPELGE